MYQGDVPQPADHDDGAEHAGGAHRGDRVRHHHEAAAPAPRLAAVILVVMLCSTLYSPHIFILSIIFMLNKSIPELFALLFQYRLKYFKLLIDDSNLSRSENNTKLDISTSLI